METILTMPDGGSRTARGYLDRAYELSGSADIKALYREWADTYDHDVAEELGLLAPAMTTALLLTRTGPADRVGPVLDIGCGTGLVAMRLAEAGFRIIDGIDITREMLAGARARGVYRELYEADITDPLPFADGCYDAAIATGLFTCGHVDARPMMEIVRVIRPGGAFAASIHRDVYIDGGFQNTFDALIKNGHITDLEIVEKPLFEKQDDTGRYVVFRRRAREASHPFAS